MSEFDRDDGINRRKVLECMTWVGTGVLWTVPAAFRARSVSWARRRPKKQRA
jgi:hypothetical protein